MQRFQVTGVHFPTLDIVTQLFVHFDDTTQILVRFRQLWMLFGISAIGR